MRKILIEKKKKTNENVDEIEHIHPVATHGVQLDVNINNEILVKSMDNTRDTVARVYLRDILPGRGNEGVFYA